MIQINNSAGGRNRGLEVLLYTREDTIKEKPTLCKFNFKKIFSILNREFYFKIEFYIKKKK